MSVEGLFKSAVHNHESYNKLHQTGSAKWLRPAPMQETAPAAAAAPAATHLLDGAVVVLWVHAVGGPPPLGRLKLLCKRASAWANT